MKGYRGRSRKLSFTLHLAYTEIHEWRRLVVYTKYLSELHIRQCHKVHSKNQLSLEFTNTHCWRLVHIHVQPFSPSAQAISISIFSMGLHIEGRSPLFLPGRLALKKDDDKRICGNFSWSHWLWPSYSMYQRRQHASLFLWVPSTKSHVIGLVSPSRTASTRCLVLHAALYVSLHLLELVHQLKSDILLVRIYSNFHSRLLMVGAKFSQWNTFIMLWW